MELTGRITNIEAMGTWSNGQRTFNKFRVSFANGDILSFLALKDFKPQVGDTIKYDKNERQGTAKWLRDEFEAKPNYNAPQAPKKSEDTQTYIIRQSMIKAAIDYHANNHAKSEGQVIETARNFVNFVING